ncbi:hypothetical protein D3C85_952540 [compost metagenome]
MALGRFTDHQVDVLHRMADADGEDQERHQDRIGIEAKAQQAEQTQLTNHCQQAGQYRHRRTAPATAIPEQQRADQAHGQGEEQRDVTGGGEQVANDLSKSDHPYRHALGAEVLANLGFQGLGEGAVVQWLAGLRVAFEQWHADDRRLKVVGHEAADHVGALDIASYLIQRLRAAVVGVRDHPAGAQAFCGDFRPQGIGRPQGLEVAAVDAGNIENLVVDLAQGLKKFLGDDIALGVLHQHSQHVALRAQDVFEFQVIGNERVPGGNHPGETGVRSQRQRRDAQHHRCNHEKSQNQPTMTEQQALGEAHGTLHGADLDRVLREGGIHFACSLKGIIGRTCRPAAPTSSSCPVWVSLTLSSAALLGARHCSKALPSVLYSNKPPCPASTTAPEDNCLMPYRLALTGKSRGVQLTP